MPQSARDTPPPGQQAMPSAIKAMPDMRLITVPAPAISAPNNSWITIGGYTSRTKPVTASPTAARASNHFIVAYWLSFSEHGDALDNPERRHASDGIRRQAPRPRQPRESNATGDLPSEYRDRKHGGDEQELTDFD